MKFDFRKDVERQMKNWITASTLRALGSPEQFAIDVVNTAENNYKPSILYATAKGDGNDN